MFQHGDMILARYSEAPDKPFVIIDKETLKPVDETEETPFTASSFNRHSLAWTPLDTEYAEDAIKGNRWFR